jgi:hypothetical protein
VAGVVVKTRAVRYGTGLVQWYVEHSLERRQAGSMISDYKENSMSTDREKGRGGQ